MTSQPDTAHPDWMEGTYPWCWLRGQVVNTASATVSIMDRGFLYGDGVFETIRIHQGKPFQWARHWVRLQQGCESLGIPIQGNEDAWTEQLHALINKNQAGNALARVHISRGLGPRGYAPSSDSAPTSIITLHRAPALPPDRPQQWNLMISEIRTPSFSLMPKWKSCNKLHQIMVKNEALNAGFDDGLVLNEHQNLTETSSGNLFLILGNRIQTPTTECGILNGTTRQLLIELASSLGLECQESPCHLDTIHKADSVFATLCSFGLVHIQRIEDQIFPLHPVEESLYQAYLKRLNAG